MNVIETRIPGNASLDKITSVINRHLGNTALARVELRYSTQSDKALNADQVKAAIGKLLREHGMVTTAVSVRHHEGQYDDASGEHVLRLFPLDKPAATPVPQSGGGWWARLLKFFGRSAPVADGGYPPPRVEPVKGVSKPQAAALLREAVERSAAYWAAQQAKIVPVNGSAAVGSAAVVVRLDSLHPVMDALVGKDLSNAAQSVCGMLRAKGVNTGLGFSVAYRYSPRVAGDGTGYAGEDDVEVVLTAVEQGTRGGSAHDAATAYPGRSPARVDPRFDDASVDADRQPNSGTALPLRQNTRAVARPAATAHILGTWQAGALVPFAAPIVLTWTTLPALLDRRALQASALATVQPHLLSVASNSCPLTVDCDSSGALVLECPTRHAPDGEVLPMYYVGKGLTPLVGRQTCEAGSVQLLLNDPAGVQDAANGGTVLPALVIRLDPRA